MRRGGVFVKQVDRLVQVVKDPYRCPLSCNVGLIGFAKDLSSRSLPYGYRLLYLLVKVCLMFDFLPIVTFQVLKVSGGLVAHLRKSAIREFCIGNPPLLIFEVSYGKSNFIVDFTITLWLFRF